MAVVLYQRSEPRGKEWAPLLSQQIRLRNVVQLGLLNPSSQEDGDLAYFTLHVSPLSAPFYTSAKAPLAPTTIWSEIQPSLFATRLSAPAVILRVWKLGPEADTLPVVSWAVHFKGLHYLGGKERAMGLGYKTNTLIFFTPFGAFTSLESLLSPPVAPQRFLQITPSPDNFPRGSYTLKNLVVLHHLQRSVLEEHELADRLRMEMGMKGLGVSNGRDNNHQPLLLSQRLASKARAGRTRLRLREEMEAVRSRVSSLAEEKGRAEGRVKRLRAEWHVHEECSAQLVARLHNFSSERVALKETKEQLLANGQRLGKLRASAFVRKKQLISELLQIYPLSLVEGSKKYSINGVQLPNAEDYGGEGGGQISVALGYTAHLIAMLAFFLDIPCRYPIRHFGSRSRIIDHITVQIPDKEREFPLYFKGKRDVYCAYAVYLLNKNIAQLRWYCGLSTPDLRASLPNLVQLLTTRLVIPGWPPNLGEALEIAQEITEDVNVDENELTMSLDKGLDKLLLRPQGEEDAPGGNYVAIGEVAHGRGQERFLSGWKKKTYLETDDFDPKWLLDSMNLDFDTGRRFSFSNAPPSKPLLLVSQSEEETEGDGRRRRRVGQVEPPKIAVNSDQQPENSVDLKRIATPSRDIVRLELDIKEFERRKSRGTANFLGIPSSSISSSPVQDSSVSSNSNLLQLPLPPGPGAGDEWVSTDDERNNSCSETSLLQKNEEYHISPPPTQTTPEEETILNATSKGEKLERAKNCDSDNREESGLWMRTEALLGGSTSFNLVRRRCSESSS